MAQKQLLETAVVEDLQHESPLAEAVLQHIEEGFVVGLGTGRAATEIIYALGRRVQMGLRIRGVPTSQATANLAVGLGIPLVGLDGVEDIDVAVDGADEVDPHLNLIKGLGGALVREKIVASAARRFVVVVGSEKLVPNLGAYGILPVEVVPFASAWCRRRLEQIGYPATLREVNGRPWLSDNGNHILDCTIPALKQPAQVEQILRAIPGIVCTGLFLGMADTVLVRDGDHVQSCARPPA